MEFTFNDFLKISPQQATRILTPTIATPSMYG
jgi:hypothetical protein